MASSASVSLLALILVLGVMCSCNHSATRGRKVIVLGVDGMDPAFLERHWNDLPNLDRLRRHGDFKRLGTTMPPQSPVAWSAFITGMDPSGHGIFDFVHRDPKTLRPFSSMSQTEQPRFTLTLGPYVLPLSRARARTLRKGQAFWEILANRRIPVTVIHMPTNFPPIQAGEAISGMGTPDLRGTLGTFTYYTDDPEELTRSVSGGRIVKVRSESGHFILPVEGPPNTLTRQQRFATADLVADVDPGENVARISVGGELAIVKQGEWSRWLHVDFPLIRGLASSTGMFRIYAKQLHPRLGIYVTPVNIDPRSPELPISTPSSYSRDVARQVGPFYTQGIAEDTSAFRQGVFDRREFLGQSRLVRDDERRLLRYSLARFHDGLLFFYFSSIDQDSHMLWGKYETELLETYRSVDGAIGEAMNEQKDARIIVMSDHGFNSFNRSVNLNTWLWQHGLLGLQGPPAGDEEPLSNVDWSKTQAYALGLNAVYLNIAGRERNGIVHPGSESYALIRKITEELIKFRDTENGRQVVEAVTTPYAESAPDMIVGYGRGYRASWQTALGAVPDVVLEDNTDAWIGDHCINAADVPGVLLSNRKIQIEKPELKDLTVTLLSLFGAQAGPGMKGRVLF
jgi:predicted AlkP superfamily phosphohydrolase/phosphomutase